MRLLVLNGSPRQKSNTKILLEKFLLGLGAGHQVEEVSLRHSFEEKFSLERFSSADCVILAFPLYSDAMPSVVKCFIEQLMPLCAREKNPPIGFIVQSGFPEAMHCRAVERYLEKLADRLHSLYLGTVIRGGVEGIQVMPPWMTRKLFHSFEELGRCFAETGNFDPDIMKQLANRERFNWSGRLGFKIMDIIGLTRWYWDTQLKKNNAFDKRHAQPYLRS